MYEVYDTSMASDLTIFIPTYNRTDKVQNQVRHLIQVLGVSNRDFGLSIDILISDNCSKVPVSFTNMNENFEINVIRPSAHLLTAEENLVFGLKQTKGEYVWILGDDDIPVYSGICKLLDHVKRSEYDFLIFNSIAVNEKSNSEFLRLSLPRIENEVSIVEFACKAGFWSIVAGFSTVLAKRNLIDFSLIEKLHASDVYIYSHTAMWLQSYQKAKVCIEATVLVNYNTNPYDTQKNEDVSKHWEMYAKSVNKPYRDPWTFGFVEILSNLIFLKILSYEDIFLSLDQGHTGARFYLADNMIGFYVDQVFHNLSQRNSLEPTNNQVNTFEEFMSNVDNRFVLTFNDIHDAKSRGDLDALATLRNNLLSPNEQLKRRSVVGLFREWVYRTPFGLVWAPEILTLDNQLGTLLQPINCLYANDLDSLVTLVNIYVSDNINNLNHFKDIEARLDEVQIQTRAIGHVLNRVRKIMPWYYTRKIRRWISSFK